MFIVISESIGEPVIEIEDHDLDVLSLMTLL